MVSPRFRCKGWRRKFLVENPFPGTKLKKSAAMHAWPNIVLVALAYLLGGFSPGYWLVRWRTGLDVRTTGSGGTGATNVGRVLGQGGYAAVLVVDVGKGALVGAAARVMGVSTAWAFAAALLPPTRALRGTPPASP